jgi:hypothetical protein
VTIRRRILLRRGTASQWSTANPTLADGEPAWDKVNRVLKIGDGVTPWASLPNAGLSNSLRAENLHVAIGDSRISNNGTDPLLGGNLFTSMCIRSNGRMFYGARFAGGGKTLEQQETEMLPSVLALTGVRKPGRCILGFVTNSLAASGGVGWSLTTTAATLQRMVAALQGAGIRPVLVTDTPRPDAAQVNTNTQIWNAWVRAYAAQNGFHLLDFYAAAVDPATGGWKSGYSTDNVHPTYPAGNAALAAAVVTEYVKTLPNIEVRRSKASDGTNLIPSGQGLFLTDTNADGLANGLSDFSTGKTYSIVDDGLVAGKWQRVQRTAGATGNTLCRFDITTTQAAGTLLEFSARLRTNGLAAQPQGVTSGMELRKTGATVLSVSGAYSLSEDIDGVIRYVAEVPAGGIDSIRVNALQLAAPITGTGGTADVAEMTVISLSALGLS